jgi:transcriptional regulator with XRE-family HTH domain
LPLKNGFGMWLRSEREARGMSMAALAHKVGITYTHISKIEVGRAQPSREMVRQLIKALDADLRTGLIVARMLPPEFRTLTDTRLQSVVLAFPKLSAEEQEKILQIAAGSSRRSSAAPGYASPSLKEEPHNAPHTSYPGSEAPLSRDDANRLFHELPPDILEMSIRIAEKMVELSKQGRKS